MRGRGCLHGEGRSTPLAFDPDVDVFVPVSVGQIVANDRRQRDTACVTGAIALLCELERALAHGGRERGRLHDIVDEPPLLRPQAADAFGRRAEDVRMIVPHLALVGEPRESAGSWQHAKERHFRQRHRRRAIVDQHDLVARERELVAAARARAVDRGQELDPRVPARVLDAVARLVRELAEVHLPGVRRKPEHEDVRAGTEHAILETRDDDGANFRALEADALQGVGELDVDAQIVGVELELVAGPNRCVFGDIHRQRRDRALERQAPMPVAIGVGTVVDEGSGAGIVARRRVSHGLTRMRMHCTTYYSAQDE